MTANHKQGWKQAFLSALQSPSFERARVKRQVLTKGSQISSEFGVFGNQRARVCFFQSCAVFTADAVAKCSSD